MRAPLSWLRDFTPLPDDVGALTDALNQLGLEVEAVEQPGREIGGVVVARILDVVAHPNADKLRLVDIEYGLGETRVVCGAPNVAAGMLVPYAGAGATLPGGFTLEPRKIRGVVSDGMLCSARELGLGDDHAGILDLDATLEPGTDVTEALGLDDVVFDLSITPNRPDAMSVVGVARDLAAHFGLPLEVPPASLAPAGPPTGELVTVAVEATDRCPRFTARHLTVTMGASPEWMARRLTLAGMRPISNVVDVTNYVLLERGQPLHAFDLGRLPGRGLVVRLASAGETIETLDGVVRTLDGNDLLVCSADRTPQAIAGIMGGGASEVHDGTTEILLEAAYFEPMGISRTSKRLGLRSESSARFERGIDPNGVLEGSARAAELLVQVAGATVAPDPIDIYPAPVERPRITVRTARVNALLGTDLDAGRVRELLAPLGIELEGEGDAPVAITPTFRPDLEREIDLVEEVARRIGLDAIPRTLPSNPDHVGGLSEHQRRRRLVADVLVGAGCSEAYTLSLLAPADVERAGVATTGSVELLNPLRAEESLLRPAILPGLLRAVANNGAQGQADVWLFETGHVFAAATATDADLPVETDHVAIALAGTVVRRPVEADRPVDVYDAIDVLHALVDGLELADTRLEQVSDAPATFHSARVAAVLVDGAVVGHVGEVAAPVLAALDIGTPVVAAELDLAAVLRASRRERHYVGPSRFPPSGVDLAFVLDDTVPAGEVLATLRAAGGELLDDVRVFDEFTSDAIGAGRRSLAFALRFRAPDRTLTDAEVGDLRRACIDAVVAAHAAELRG